MLNAYDLERRAKLESDDLESWVESGWLSPSPHPGALQFSDLDLARARLIRDLKGNMGINDDGVAVILDLVDQIQGLRGVLDEVVSAICVQPATVQQRIAHDARRLTQLNRMRRRSRRLRARGSRA